jgi:hypothetical protein
VSPRTICAPPSDAKMWKRLLRAAHPDITGDDGTLFIWCRELQAHVAGNGVEEMPREARREPSGASHHASAGSSSSSGRIPYDADFAEAMAFLDLTLQALDLADRVGEPYASVLRLLRDCEEASEADRALYRKQGAGASYRQLARIAHEVGMSKQQRISWYRLCEGVPLSMRHASHILSRL